MPVPTQLSDLSATAASNSPAGTDTVGTTMDDFLRAHASIIARISAGTDALATPNVGAATGTSLVLSGLATVNGAFTSLGLDDNATAKALTLSGSGANSVTIANSATNPTLATSGGYLAITPAIVGEYGTATNGVFRRVGTDYESQGTVTNPVDRSFIHDYRPLGTAQGGAATFSADGANTFVGHSAGNFTMTPNVAAIGDDSIHCSYNAGFGTQALTSLTTGYNNAGCGVNALRYTTQGYSNAAIGRDSMENNTTGFYNSAIGQSALHENTTGAGNVAIGGKSGYSNTTGNYNTYIGFMDSASDPGITTGSYNVIIGRITGLSSSLANNLRIGDGQGNVWLSGDSTGNITSPRGAIGYSTGAGGTVTQATNKGTGVTLDKPFGTITMNGATLAAGATVAFTLTNSFIADNDIVVASLDFNSVEYNAWCYRSNAGSANIALKNISAGDLSEAVVIKFAVIKGAVS